MTFTISIDNFTIISSAVLLVVAVVSSLSVLICASEKASGRRIGSVCRRLRRKPHPFLLFP